MKVYVYKEYCGSEAFGDECIMIFAHRQDAVDHMEARFHSYLEEIGADTEEDAMSIDAIDDDFICVHRWNEDHFFTVEEQKVWQ